LLLSKQKLRQPGAVKGTRVLRGGNPAVFIELTSNERPASESNAASEVTLSSLAFDLLATEMVGCMLVVVPSGIGQSEEI
jgi:hypothetical protein